MAYSKPSPEERARRRRFWEMNPEERDEFILSKAKDKKKAREMLDKYPEEEP